MIETVAVVASLFILRLRFSSLSCFMVLRAYACTLLPGITRLCQRCFMTSWVIFYWYHVFRTAQFNVLSSNVIVSMYTILQEGHVNIVIITMNHNQCKLILLLHNPFVREVVSKGLLYSRQYEILCWEDHTTWQVL